jgi:hypothetical protein
MPVGTYEPQLVVERLAERHHGVLARVVRAHQGAGDEPGGRGRVHHVPLAAVLEHERHEAADAVDDSHEIHAQDPLPVLQAALPEVAAPARDARVVEEEVHGAERRFRRCRGPVEVLGFRHVGSHPDRFRSHGPHLRHGGLERVLLHVGEHELHALAGADAGELESESAPCSGDDGHPAGEVLHARAPVVPGTYRAGGEGARARSPN